MWYVSFMQIESADNFIASLGVEAYRVGGSVRDEILGRTPKDADYMVRGIDLTSLERLLREKQPRKVSALVDRRNQQFGWRAGDIEISLPRREANAGSGRDQYIEVGPDITLEEDARRRDFTFNALYAPIPRTEFKSVVDPTQRGLYDLSRGLISTTHMDSFRDDPLRTLRALRFVARGFSLSTNTEKEMRWWKDEVTGLSANGYASGTVRDEMDKILMGDNVATALRVARDTGVLAVLFPELAPMIGYDQGSRYHDLTTDEHTFAALETAAHVDAPLRVRWALLFHDSGKPATAWIGKDGRKHYYGGEHAVGVPVGLSDLEEVITITTEDHEVAGERIWRATAERIGVPRVLREDVAHLIRHHMVPLDGKFKAARVRQGRVRHGDGMLRDLYMHRACDISGKGVPNEDHMERIARMEATRREARVAGVPFKPAHLEVNGHDAMEAGLTGKAIGEALATVLHEVASQPTERTLSREWQLGRLESLVS